MMQTHKARRIIFISFMGVALLSSVALIIGGVRAQNLSNSEKRKNEVNQTAIIQAKTASMPIQNAAREATTSFFSVLHTYKDQDSYNNRVEQVKNVSSKSVYENDTLFAPDQYNKISQLKLTSRSEDIKFISTKLGDGVVIGTVIDKYTVQMDDNDKRSVQMIYNVTYDSTSKMISDVQVVGQFNLSADSSLF